MTFAVRTGSVKPVSLGDDTKGGRPNRLDSPLKIRIANRYIFLP